MTALWDNDAITLAGMLRGLRVAWSADLGLPVEPAVRAALAPARAVLAGLGGEVSDAAPDLSGGDEVFRTWRALRFVTAFGPLLRAHPGDLGRNVTWNIERGQELTVADLSRATTLWAALAERVSAFFTVRTGTCHRAALRRRLRPHRPRHRAVGAMDRGPGNGAVALTAPACRRA